MPDHMSPSIARMTSGLSSVSIATPPPAMDVDAGFPLDESRIADLRVPFANIPELPGATSTHAPTVHDIPAADTITKFKGKDKGKGRRCGKFKDKDKNGKYMELAGQVAVANTADALLSMPLPAVQFAPFA